MGRVMAVANQKGGVGKTTTAINLASSLPANDLKILLIDLDPQGNATTGLGIPKTSEQQTTYHVLVADTELKHVIVRSSLQGLSIAPPDRNLAAANVELDHSPD